MKKEKKKKRFQKLKLLNPKNLSAEVHVYGYNFSWKAHMLVVLCTLLGICSIGVLFKLESTYFIITLLAACVMLPVLVLETYKRMYEQKRFADAVTYAEQILYSFQKNGKVISALRETREIYEDGQMKQAIEDAIVHLEIGCAETEKGVLREALEMIEKQYACVKIHMVHELLISSEEFGGDVSNSILLVLNDIELWKRRGYKLQADKKTSHTDNIISIVVATILCAAALYVLDAMGKMFPNVERFNIFGVGVIQISSFVFILFLMFVLAKSIRSLTENWLNNEALMDADYILSSYDTVMNYDEKKEKKKSILFALPFAVGTAASFYFENVWIAVICILLVAFMLMQHRVGYSMAKKDVNRELYIALPQWLIEIALLLQGNNVQVSIAKSRVEAPAVLQKELLLLTERLQQEPDKLSSYTDFCKDFDVPEVQSCMKMLHAISESGAGNADVQINNLIQRVNEMQDMADNIRNESIAFRMKMLFSYPVLAATVKLLIDLTLGMFYMLQLLGNMGGV